MRILPVFLALLAAAPAVAQPASPDAGHVYELSEVEVLPRPQNAAEFMAALQQSYPPPMREAAVGGTVHVSFVLGPNGQPGDVRVLSTPDSSFDAPTVQAVSLLRFTPAQVQGRPVAVRVEQPITWRVDPAPEPVASTSSADFHGMGPNLDSVRGNPVDGYELSEVDDLPRPANVEEFRRLLAHNYPLELRAAGVSATVQVRFRVEVDGTTSSHTITHSSNREFDEPTLSATRELRFRPARLHRRPVRVWVEQPIVWQVNTAADEPVASALTDALDVADVLEGAAKVHELSEVEEVPDILNNRDFERALRQEYPSVEGHPGRQAVVRVRFRVAEDGSTSHASVTRSTDQRFNTPTLNAVRVLRFRPARVGGQAVKVWVEMPISWSLVMGIPGWNDTENGTPGSRARRPGSPTYTTPSPR